MLDESCMVGKRIERIEVGGFGVLIVLDDGTIFDYKSSGGGNSCWDILNEPNCGARMVRE